MKLIAEVPVNQKQALIDVSKVHSAFYKLRLGAPLNTVNKWEVPEQTKK